MGQLAREEFYALRDEAAAASQNDDVFEDLTLCRDPTDNVQASFRAKVARDEFSALQGQTASVARLQASARAQLAREEFKQLQSLDDFLGTPQAPLVEAASSQDPTHKVQASFRAKVARDEFATIRDQPADISRIQASARAKMARAEFNALRTDGTEGTESGPLREDGAASETLSPASPSKQNRLAAKLLGAGFAGGEAPSEQPRPAARTSNITSNDR